MEYRVLKEYKKFYLCISKSGYRECFNKFDYKPDENGKIFIKSGDDVARGDSES